jgi:hypothetical protein
MGGLLAMLNHLAATWLARQEAGAAWRFTEIALDAQGGTVRAEVAQGGFAGQVLLRLEADPPQDGRQTLHLKVEQWPATMPPALEPFRRVLQKARLNLELDFNP